MWHAKFLYIVPYSILIIDFCAFSLLAQTIPDNTLGRESSTVNFDVTINNKIADLIEGGAIRDNNLFHSFSEFNIGADSAIYFANPNNITNILTRITGNNTSEILGTLGVNGTANLFLLNPNGIVFGENATLDVNGSFLATTADNYIFENDFAYSSSNPEIPPLLTIDIPHGLQFGSKAESIINRSQTLDESDFFAGLQVTPDHNITLLGGDVVFERGHLNAPSGRIEVGSVAPDSFVALKALDQHWSLDYSEITTWQNIQLTQGSSIDTSGDGAGGIQVRGKQIQLWDGSGIFAVNFGEQHSEDISIFASELLELKGGEQEETLSLIQSLALDSGDGGNLELDTDVLQLVNGGQIGTGTSGAGNSGKLSIEVQEATITGTSIDDYSSGLFTSVGDFTPDPLEASGRGGDLNLETAKLHLSDGGLIGAGTFGVGNGGDILINAQQIVVDGAEIDSSTYDQGDSGNMTINTHQLKVIGEVSQISTGNFGSGQAGNLTIKAKDSIEISGVGLFPSFEVEEQLDIFANGLFTSVESGAMGNGGNLILETNKLQVSDGGKIVANTLGVGNAGNISIRAKSIQVEDAVTDFFGGRSGINSNVEILGIGDGGDINIYAESLEVNQGGSIAVDAKGQGNAGNIYLEAQEISLKGTSDFQVIAGTEQPSLTSQISAFAQGDSNAGSISINANTLEVTNQAEISVSNKGSGDSGNLNITTAQDLLIENSGKLSAEVNGGDQGNINLISNNLFLRNDGLISAQAQGESTGGNITINSTDNLVILENSTIIANAIQGNGGEIEIVTQGYFVSGDSSVTAKSRFGIDGNINVETINGDRPLEFGRLPEKITDETQKITRTCSVGANQFAIAGKGGLPENPGQNLRGTTVWQDLRLSLIREQDVDPTSSNNHFSNSVLVEANSWQMTPQGKVKLLARNRNQSSFRVNQFNCHELASS